MTYCGHKTNRKSGICKACTSAYIAGVLPINDGRQPTWRKQDYKRDWSYRKTKKCGCGAMIRPTAKQCKRCHMRSVGKTRKPHKRLIERNKAILRELERKPRKVVAAEFKLSINHIDKIKRESVTA